MQRQENLDRYNDVKNQPDTVDRLKRIASIISSLAILLIKSNSNNLKDYLEEIDNIVKENKDVAIRLYDEVKSQRSKESCRTQLRGLLSIGFVLAFQFNDFSLINMFSKESLSNIKPDWLIHLNEYGLKELMLKYYQKKVSSYFVESTAFKLLEKYHPEVIHKNLNGNRNRLNLLLQSDFTDFVRLLRHAPDPIFYLYIAKDQDEAKIKEKKLAKLEWKPYFGGHGNISGKVSVVPENRYEFFNEYALILLKVLAQHCVSKSNKLKISYRFFGGGKKIIFENNKVILPDTMAKMVMAYQEACNNPKLSSSLLSEIMLLAAEKTIKCANANPQRDSDAHLLYDSVMNGVFWRRYEVSEEVQKAILARDLEIQNLLNQQFPNPLTRIIKDYADDDLKPADKNLTGVMGSNPAISF